MSDIETRAAEQEAASARMPIRPRDDSTYDSDPGRGWILFAGIMLSVVGVLNVIYGIGAISTANFYVRDVAYVIGDLNTFGWLLLVVGVAQIAIAFGIWAATEWGRWLGVLAAAANMIVQFLVFPAYPGVAVILFFVDVIVIYGLLTYGGRDRRFLGD